MKSPPSMRKRPNGDRAVGQERSVGRKSEVNPAFTAYPAEPVKMPQPTPQDKNYGIK